MKKLLLNFLFFVGAAIIFFQCAKLFPSELVNSNKKVIARNRAAQKHSHHIGVAQYFANTYTFRHNFRAVNIISYTGNGVFPLNILQYINKNPFVANHKAGFNYVGITGKPLYPKMGLSRGKLLTASNSDDDQVDYPENVK
jgi:hypothetical protein